MSSQKSYRPSKNYVGDPVEFPLTCMSFATVKLDKNNGSFTGNVRRPLKARPRAWDGPARIGLYLPPAQCRQLDRNV